MLKVVIFVLVRLLLIHILIPSSPWKLGLWDHEEVYKNKLSGEDFQNMLSLIYTDKCYSTFRDKIDNCPIWPSNYNHTNIDPEWSLRPNKEQLDKLCNSPDSVNSYKNFKYCLFLHSLTEMYPVYLPYFPYIYIQPTDSYFNTYIEIWSSIYGSFFTFLFVLDLLWPIFDIKNIAYYLIVFCLMDTATQYPFAISVYSVLFLARPTRFPGALVFIFFLLFILTADIYQPYVVLTLVTFAQLYKNKHTQTNFSHLVIPPAGSAAL